MNSTMVNSTIPVPSAGTDHSVEFLAPCGALFAIVVVTSVTRIYCRLRLQQRLDWSDYTLIVAFLLSVIGFALDTLLYTRYGRGIDNYVYDFNTIAPIEITIGLVFLWALNIIRASMCLMLLRLKDGPMWKWPLWGLIALQVCLTIVNTGVQTGICRPLSGVYAPTPETVCISPQGLLHYAYVFNACNIFSDVVISLMPLTFIPGMKRTVLEKILLVGLMGFGLLATTAAVITLATVLGALEGQTIASANVHLDLLTTPQVFLGVIAANLPFLKSPVHNLLLRWGVLGPRRHPADASPDSLLTNMTNGSHFRRQLQQLGRRSRAADKDQKASGITSSCTAADSDGSRQDRNLSTGGSSLGTETTVVALHDLGPGRKKFSDSSR